MFIEMYILDNLFFPLLFFIALHMKYRTLDKTYLSYFPLLLYMCNNAILDKTHFLISPKKQM